MSTEFSGALDQRVVLQLPLDTADGGGGKARLWQDTRTFWANIVPQVQDELRYAGHVATRIRYTIGLRRDGDIPLAARPDRQSILAEQEREQ